MLTAISEHFLQWEHFFRGLGLLGVLAYALAIVFLQMICLPMSPFGIMAGLFFGVANGFIAVEIGTTIGAAVNFLLSRYFVRERVAHWLSGHEKFLLIDAAIGRAGWKIIALLRFCPVPFGIANYSYGLTAVSFLPYMLATVFAIIPANFFFVWFGATSQDAIKLLTGEASVTTGQTIFTVVGLVSFFLVLAYVGRIARAAIAPIPVVATPGSEVVR